MYIVNLHWLRAATRRVKQGAQFTTEVEFLSQLFHKNLLDLIGFCVKKGEGMLLYDYTANGSLQHILFGTDTAGIRLDWGSKVGVALEFA